MATRIASLEQLESLRERIRSSRDPSQTRIIVCGATGCRANQSYELAQDFRKNLDAAGHNGQVSLKLSGCHGFCQQGPVVVIEPEGLFYCKVGTKDRDRDVRDIVGSALEKGDAVERLLYRDPATGEKVAHYRDITFYARQQRIALRNNGRIDPNDIEDYIAEDGYGALARVLSMDPEEVIECVKRSGLRGRGGGGFSTGLKWSLCREAENRSMRYVICNADEGDPGAFMDRSLMEGDPHSVLEGMAIGAYAMSRGISPVVGYVYIRAEYPLAVQNLRQAIAQAEEAGLLGDNILGTDFHFHIKIKEGAGAFICGEETSLIRSIEGKRGMPRVRPPFPVQVGLHGKPTCINNVETWANIPPIVQNGADWYAAFGTEESRGTKVFSLVGKTCNSGLVEVPMGITLREIIFDIGGGILGGKRFKAVQTGGPSGGCLPASLLDTPVDFEELAAAGAIMGSGGMVVMDEDTCMVDVARYFIDFTQSESCGKCPPCRLGTRQMLGILDDITAGKGRKEDLTLLERLGNAIQKGSLCGLGQTAPNPVLTSLRYFREEYEAHLPSPEWGVESRCPAGVCREVVGAPCRYTCPAGVDVARYIRLIAAGRYQDAVDVVRERVPLPAVCGEVCFHPCEMKCRRGEIDEPIAIRALKRFAVERGTPRRPRDLPQAKPTGKRVAIVGSGPSGLTAGYYLARKGHEVTVFEREAEPGGTLWTGIPTFRLSRDTIKADIDEIRNAGVQIRTNTSVASVDELLEGGYDVVLLAYGAMKGTKMDIPGDDLPGVYDVLTFLRSVNLGERPDLGERVAIIGGGSSAMDGAATALRLGAREVTVLYRRTRAEMPAAPEEVKDTLAEGVQIEFLTAPVEIRAHGKELIIRCIRMELGPEDSSGRRRPVPIPGSEYEQPVHTVIMAIGQTPEPMPELGCDTDRWGSIPVHELTLQANRPEVFAAGDVVTGPSSIIEAIAAGRRAAISMDRYLGGDGDIQETIAPPEEDLHMGEIDEETRPRAATRKLSPAERAASFDQIDRGFDERTALAEAGRCLRCDLADD